MFPDSKIANKYKNGRIKTSNMLIESISKQTANDLKEIMSMTWHGIVTDGRSDGNDKYLPILIGHIEKKSELLEISLLGIPNVSSGSKAQQMFNVCNKVIENFSLDWNKYVTYSSDNSNSMAGSYNRLLKKIKDSQAKEKVFDVGCPFNVAHICRPP